ncbi:hypothetical protein INT45_009792 [Circinella minor]|uniref:Uncharacterized protein n=1 Tax=Circinella minor TaxID=1195481 RepID=A0A8H7VFZ8_9FUNG|nr:hypothetical protein INT45_009792 [Circinella minor]
MQDVTLPSPSRQSQEKEEQMDVPPQQQDRQRNRPRGRPRLEPVHHSCWRVDHVLEERERRFITNRDRILLSPSSPTTWIARFLRRLRRDNIK